MYNRPPSYPQEIFKSLDRCSTVYDDHNLLVDLNFDMLSETKSRPPIDIMELVDYKKQHKRSQPTYFKEDSIPTINGPRREKTCLRCFANNKGTDKPAHPCRLISASVIRFLESIICKLASDEFSIF